jgi:hypothetical protein
MGYVLVDPREIPVESSVHVTRPVIEKITRLMSCLSHTRSRVLGFLRRHCYEVGIESRKCRAIMSATSPVGTLRLSIARSSELLLCVTSHRVIVHLNCATSEVTPARVRVHLPLVSRELRGLATVGRNLFDRRPSRNAVGSIWLMGSIIWVREREDCSAFYDPYGKRGSFECDAI